ncbi:MAG: methyltransferase domain-containing protein [Candidatus Omnitrophota bacterium]|jgi:SAM-dependent methyltransferase
MLKFCPVCSGSFNDYDPRSIPYPSLGHNGFVKKPSSIIFCKNCHAGIAYPGFTDEELAGIYFKGYYPKDSKASVILPKVNPGHYALAKGRWDYVKQFTKKGSAREVLSILDVGGGHGFFGVAAAKDKLPSLKEYCVIEKDKSLRDSLTITWRKEFQGIDFSVRDSLSNAGGKYDLIVFSHILEHLNEPGRILKEAASKLNEKGLIFADVPNQDYLFKENVFPHLLFFDKISLEGLFKINGFDLIDIESFGFDRSRKPSIKKSFVNKAEGFLYKMRYFLPEELLSVAFSRILKVSKKNTDGAWLRVIACIKEN